MPVMTRRLRQLLFGIAVTAGLTLLAETGSVAQVGGQVAAAEAALEARRPDFDDNIDPVNGKSVGKAAKVTPKIDKRLMRRPEAKRWPTPGATEVDVGKARSKASRDQRAQAGGLPISVRAAKVNTGNKKAVATTAGKPPESVRIQLHERKVAQRAGLPGPVISVARTDGGGKPAPVEVEIDYSSFAPQAGGFASRLWLLDAPACGLASAEPEQPQCRQYNPIYGRNNHKDQTLTATVPAQPEQSADERVLVLAASPEGPEGDYKATDLKPSAEWNVGGNAGNFTWTYPIPVTDMPSGLSPDLKLSYDSGSVDGHTSATNNQASWVGDGWDLETGFIERKYKTCRDDGHWQGGSEKYDLCWGGDHLMLALPGHAGDLYKADDGTYRFKNDDGTKVERKTGGWGNTRNGEYFVVTTTDGTRYYFGRGRRTENDPFHSLSAWHAPVFGDDAGEPCHGSSFKTSHCRQGWRWNLDYVVDVHGNSMTFFYQPEYNFYGRNRNQAVSSYVRGGYLKRIEYGTRTGSDTENQSANAQVIFDVEERCFKSGDVNCTPGELKEETRYNWPDTPYDQICKSQTSCPDNFAPAFFSRKRLVKITTQVRSTSGGWSSVDAWGLGQGFAHTNDGTPNPLWLSSIKRTGMPGADIALPSVKFDGTLLRGRVDSAVDDLPPTNRWRLSEIVTESGARVNIEYANPDCHPGNIGDIKPHTNTTMCFPQYWTPEGANDPQRDWFHKYVVSSVIEDERVTGGQDVETRYKYLGGAAWHYDQSPVAAPNRKSWSEWRGYQKVRTTIGSRSSDTRTETVTTYLRGMDEDLRHPDGGLRDVRVTPSRGDDVEDKEQLAGYVLEEQTLDGPGGALAETTIKWPYVSAPTADGPSGRVARIVKVRSEQTWIRRNNGDWRHLSRHTAYDEYGMPTRVNDVGEVGKGGDNRCTRNEYARNTGKHLIEPIKRVEVVAQSCGDQAQRPQDVVSDERFSYDGQAYGEEPTKGDPTRKETLKDYSGTSPVYLAEETKKFDIYGRDIETADAHGNTTTTAFTPATGTPVESVTVTNPLEHTETTLLDPYRAQPRRVTDANGRRAELVRDALGRLTKVWLPGRSTSGTPDLEYTYAIRQNAPTTVITRTLMPNGNQSTSVKLYDGLLRERQIQAPAPGGGRVIADTRYDSRGEEWMKGENAYADGDPSTTLLSIPDNELPARVETLFDGQGRPIDEVYAEFGDEKWRTETAYDADSETVTPPSGGTPTTTITDARDRTTQIRHYKDDRPTGDYEKITYTYDKHDQLASIADHAGNQWHNRYDLRGRKVEADDPDKGKTTYTYDTLDRQISTTDARGNKIFFNYDALGRKTAVRENSISGTKRAVWRYDALPDGTPAKGDQTGSTRFYGSHAYSSDTTAVDAAGRPTETQITIPGIQGALAGTYEFDATYRPDGTQDTVSYPAAGDLGAESVYSTFDNIGLAKNTKGADDYVHAAYYTKFGEPMQYTLAASGTAERSWLTWYYQQGSRRLDEIRLDRQTNPAPDTDLRYRYDPAGNITSIADHADGKAERQCFTYDHLRRLKQAWAQGGTGNCADTPAKNLFGGPAPYWHSYSYDAAGNRTKEVQHNTDGDTTRTFSYPAAGQDRPHAVSSVTENGPGGSRLNQYGYDPSGNTTGRNLAGENQTLTWDAEGHLARVTETGKETSFAYDADGNRIIRAEPDAITLYLPFGMELTLNKNNQGVTATRYYTHGDSIVAMRQPGKVTYLTADHHQTTTSQINADTLAITQRRALPFGNPRGTDPQDWLGDKGFVGGTQDKTTGLTHLGAREYDPDIGRFISVDPAIDPADPLMLDAYGYAGNNPVTASDPNGEDYCDLNPCPGDEYYEKRKNKKKKNKKKKAREKKERAIRDAKAKAGRSVVNILPAKLRPKFWKYYHALLTAEQMRKARGHLAEWIIAQAWKAAFQVCAEYDCDRETGWAVFKGRWFADKVYREAFLTEGASIGAGLVPGLRQHINRLIPKVGSAACSSFVAGTAVVMSNGARKSIEDVQVGDKVLATDPTTGKAEAKTVVATIIRDGAKRLVQVSVDPDGAPSTSKSTNSSVIATHNHPFWVTNLNRWVPADKLRPGMWLRASSGTFVQISAVQGWTARRKVHNLTVDDLRTYHVATGSTDLLVHNSTPCSRLLGANLELAGHMPKAGEAAHHIVAGKDARADPARRILDKFGIDINDASNGVWLPGNSRKPNPGGAVPHSRVHTSTYYDSVNDALSMARTRQEAIAILNQMGRELRDGAFG